MPPTPPSHDDALDLDGLDLKPSGGKAKPTAESDFEKELEALFAEELASSDEKPASAPPVGGPEFEEDALLLDDLVLDAPLAPAAQDASADDDEDDILDLSAFADGGPLELTPPEDIPGGKGGDIDLSGLDELISGLGDPKNAAADATETVLEPMPVAEPVAEPEPLGDLDMSDLLESDDAPLDIPAAPKAELMPEPEDDLLELSLGDLVEDMPEVEPLVAEGAPDFAADLAKSLADGLADSLAAPSAPEPDDSVLDLELPDLSDPEPGRDLVAEQEQADIGGDLNLSLPDLPLGELADEEPSGLAESSAAVDQMLDSSDLDMSGLMGGIETSGDAPEAELSLDPQALLAQISDAPAAPISAEAEIVEPELLPEMEPALEPVEAYAFEDEPVLEAVVEPVVEPAPDAEPMPLADAALGAVAAGVVIAGAGVAGAAFASQPEAAASQAEQQPGPGMSDAALADLQHRLAQLSTQVTGNSVTVMRLEGQLAERDKTLSEMDERLQASQAEALSLREELASLRAYIESSLHTQSEEVKQSLAQSTQASADKAQAAMDKALGAMDKALAALDKAQAVADKVETLTPRVESAEMTVRGAGARLAQMEDRQSQMDREVFAEISRAVPREAAKVIREEIAHLAASMRDE